MIRSILGGALFASFLDSTCYRESLLYTFSTLYTSLIACYYVVE